ncbi:hypothetical protein EV1_009328 [Malus domestica]
MNNFRELRISSSAVIYNIRAFLGLCRNLEPGNKVNAAETLRGLMEIRSYRKTLILLSASSCVALSLMKLVKHNYGKVAKGDIDKRNKQSPLSIFYLLELA